MKTNVIIYVLMLLTVAGCSKDDTLQSESLATTRSDALIMDVAEVVETKTRGGAAGSIDYAHLALNTHGFGVISPDLVWYNHKVSYADDGTTNPGSAFLYPSKWSYAGELKYWNAIMTANPEGVDFYAYAPWVDTSSSLGTTGITGVTSASVSYTISTDITTGVDLLWGVKGTTGLPWENTTYAMTGGPVLFTFRHALAAIGFRIQAMIGQENNLEDLDDESALAGVLRAGGNYKITVKKVELSGNFHPSGVLNLDNVIANTPNWSSKADATAQTLTVNADPNGDNDNTDSQIVSSMKHLHAKATTTTAEAKTIMDDVTNNGVSQEPQQQMVADAGGQEPLFFVIPSGARDYTLTLHWCVNAVYPDGTTYVTEDRVTPITLKDLELVAGTKYLMTFVIGLKLISLEVTATDWNIAYENADVLIEHGTSASESLSKRLK